MADPSNTFRTHWQTLRRLKGKARREFVWEYYKLHICVILVALGLAAYAVHGALNPSPTHVLNVAAYGVYADDETLAGMSRYFFERLEETEGAVPEAEGRKSYDALVEAYAVDSDDLQINSAMRQKFTANIMLGEIDMILTTERYLDELRAQGILPDGGEGDDPAVVENEPFGVGEGFRERFGVAVDCAVLVPNGKNLGNARAVLEGVGE